MYPKDQHKTAFVTPFWSLRIHTYAFRFDYSTSDISASNRRGDVRLHVRIRFSVSRRYTRFSKTFDEHLTQLDRIFSRIEETGLKLKTLKCQLLRREVNYIGHTVSAHGVGCETEKTEVVRNWQRPKTVKELRSFLGFASYYRRFVKNFSQKLEFFMT